MKRTFETAAALLIGNELLSGKIQDANLIELARMLRALGMHLVRAAILPDDVTQIADELSALRRSADVVFTSGGVGPTHDDVTVQAVARAFGVPVVRDPSLEALLRNTYGPRCTEIHLRMALVPQGAELLSSSDVKWPVTSMGNVFLLPGVPEIFRAKLDVIRAHVQGPMPFASRAVFLRVEEADLTDVLDAVVAQHATVEIGSYPKWFEPSYKTKVTFDGRDGSAVQSAADDFIRRLGADAVVRVE
jgi:molybdenum cofactor synthesis domain-containing protein